MDSEAELILNKEHRYSMSELFPVFLDTYDAKMLQLKPSTYISELQLSTEERMQKLIKPFRKCNSFKSAEMEMLTNFTPIPRIIIFQNYNPGKTYTAQLLVRNDTNVLKPLEAIYKNTTNFTVTPSVKKSSYLAPGMSVSFRIQFAPDKKQDYTHNIKFCSCEEHFNVPIAAIGPRPMLDFPDQIELPCTPVKIPVTKYFIVKNIGEIEAVFSLFTDSPFAVEPRSGRVQPGGAMEWCLVFQSQTVGDFSKLLTINYETGESVHIKLLGTADKANVYLEKTSVVIGDTFMGLKRESSFLIFNKTEHIVNFRWKRLPDAAHDIEEIERLKERFQMVRDLEMKKSMQIQHLCHVDSNAHEIVYDRIYSDEIEALKQQELDFKDRNFILLPESGEIWPENWIEITIIFMPDKAQNFCIKAYCDILGAEHRLPLTITGVGQGPLLRLNVRSLDAGYIVAQAFHSYEIVVTNSGDIPGTIKFMPSRIVFGGVLYCDPKKLHLNPDDYKTFVITFNSSTLGYFQEHIKFLIEESNEVLQFMLKGEIIIPVVHFSKKILNLNDVGIGFPVSCMVALHNLSPVSVKVSLTVKPDGLEQSLTYKEFFNMKTKEILPPCPKEIVLQPLNGILEPEKFLNIKVTVTANSVGRHCASLMMHMKDLDAEPMSLPIVFSAKIADIECTTKEIYIKHCFINLPYKRDIILHNSSNVPGAFIICSQEVNNESAIIVSLPRRQGLVKPGGRAKVPVFIMTSVLGRQRTSVSFLIMGYSFPTVSCPIICDGEGPVISVVPLDLPWHETLLLKPSMKEVKVINDGPVPATIEVNLVKTKTPWSISPTNFMLNPDETNVIEVVIYLNDTGNYSDSLEIRVANSRTITVSLTAIGIGTSITVEPPIETLDLGLLYISQKIVKELVVENKGTRHHQLLWSPQLEVKDIVKAPAEFPENSVFCLEPCKFDLAAKEQEIVFMKVECPEICTKTEKIYCHGVINYKEKKLALIVAEITATFIEPVLEFSKENVAFRIDMGPNDILHILTDSVILSNVTELPITLTLEVEYPFYLSFDNRRLAEHLVYLEKMSSLEIFIQFDPAYKDDKYCRKIKSFLLVTAHETPFKISLPLEGEVNFPNVKIDRDCIDFGCIPIGTEGYEDIIVQNVSPLPVVYKWYLSYEQEDTLTVESLPLAAESVDSPTLKLSKMDTSETDEAIVQAEGPGDGLWFDKVPDHVRITFVEGEGSENKLHSPGGCVSPEQLSPAENQISPQSSISVFDESSSVESDESQRRKANSKVLKQILVPSIICYFEEQRDGEVLKKLPRTQDRLNLINQAFEISPTYGYIEPYGEEIVRVAFNGYTNLSQEIMAIIDVENGPSECLIIKGKASEIRYNLSSTTLDAGNTLFCDVCEKKVVISNTGILGFTYSVISTICQNDLRVCESSLERGVLSVRPQSGYLEKDEFKDLTIQYFPGVPGEFSKTFSFQIGFLKPVNILIMGKGVFPQVEIMLPRSISHYPPPETSYAAINYLCANWNEQKEKLITSFRSAFSVSEEELMDLKEDNWIVVSRQDNFPSAVCIDLEVERVMAYDVAQRILFSVSEVKGKTRKTLPEFQAPPYYLDFGPVIIGEQASQNVIIANPGPLVVTIALPQNQEELAESGVFVMLERVLHLAPGDTATLNVVFEPVAYNYSEKITEVEKVLNLEVSYGATVPIILHATVTVPFVTASLEFLDFGEVKCGTCKVMHFYLVNEGCVPCKWKIDFLPQWNLRKKHKQRFANQGSVHMFYTKQTMGTYEPQQFGLIEVIFEPMSAGVHDSVFGVKMECNPEEIFIKMEGKGIEPAIDIDNSSLQFHPVDPYADLVIEMFRVRNPNDFPVEIFLRDVDRQYDTEEKVLTSLCYFYKEETLYLPVRTAGRKICNEFQSFYDRIIALISEKISEQKEDHIIAAVSDDGRNLAPLKSDLSQDITEGDMVTKGSFHSSLPCLEMPTEENDISSKLYNLLSASDGDLDTVLQECIEELRKEGSFPLFTEDPVKDVLKQLKVEPDTSIQRSHSACIVFHGAPSTDCLYHAHHTGRLLGFTVLNIDQIIVEAAAYGIHPDEVQVREAIITNYDLYEEPAKKPVEEPVEGNGDENVEKVETEEQDPEDYFNSLKRKVKIINEKRKKSTKDKFSKKPGQKTPSKQTPRSNASQKSKKGGAVEVMEGILPEIPNEIFIEILTRRFASLEQPFGVIIESLDSGFLCPETTALLAVFQAVGNVKFLHCVILYDTFTRYTERKEAEENRKKEEQLNKIAYLEQMAVEEISDLSDDDVILYNKLQLKKRKENLKLRNEERENRKGMKILQELQKKKNMPAGKKPGKASQKTVSQKSTAGKGRLSEVAEKPAKAPVASVTPVTSNRRTVTALTPEQIKLRALQMTYNTFEQRLPQLLHIIENWDRRLGVLCESEEKHSLKGKTFKKDKTSPRSVTQTGSIATDQDGNVLNDEDTLNKQWLGASLWIYNYFYESSDHLQYIGTHLKVTSDVKRFQIALEESKKLKLPELELFTCYHEKKSRETHIDSSVFLLEPQPFVSEISDVYDETKATEPLHFKTEKKRKRPKTAPSVGSQASVQKQEDMAHIHGDASSTRWLLQPGDCVQFKVQFCPKYVGEYSHEFRFGISDWSAVYTVDCYGLCDIPRIDDDPYVMFDKVEETKPANKIYTCTYFLDKGVFDFGAVLASKQKKAQKTTGLFHISNCSTLTVNAQFSFLEMEPDEPDVYEIEPMNMTVEPGCTETLNILVCPRSLGAVEHTLICSVKDNPVPTFIKIICYGVKVDFEVDPKIVSFDYMLLFRKDSRILTLKNKTLVPFLWRFVGTEMLENDFEISDTMAIIKPLENQSIEFTYCAKEVQVIAKKPLKLEVFEEEGRGDPLCTETIYISAEAIDAKVDILFAPRCNHVYFGKLKVGHEYEHHINLKNKGKYELNYKIQIEGQPNLPLEELEGIISILPDSGIVPPGDKPVPVKVLCLPKAEIDIKELPLLKCHFLERGSPVSVIPINVTLQSFSSRFVISPKPDVIFPPQLIGTSKMLDLIIKNVGELNFKFLLKRLRAPPIEENPLTTTGKSSGKDGKAGSKKAESKSAKSKSSGKGKRVDAGSLLADNFTLTPCTGVIDPESTAVIAVSFSADVEGKFMEEIIVEVSEPFPLAERSTLINLHAISCLPAIDLKNAESMFQEHYICESVNDFVCPEKVEEHCLFVKDEHKLIFNKVVLGSKLSAAIWLHNPGFVTCDLSARLLPPEGQPIGDVAFHVDPTTFCVSPQAKEKLLVTFQPYSLNVSTCILELTVEVPVPHKSQKTLILLEGEPVVPEIKIILPANIENTEIPLTFLQTPINQSSNRTLKIANSGVISSEVAIEFSENSDNVFNLIPVKETSQLLQNLLPDESIRKSTRLKICPNQTATFEIKFHPERMGNFTGQLNIISVLNPFEVHTINIIGEGFVEEMVIQGLGSTTPDETDADEDMPVKVYYHLDFGYCYPGKLKEMSFKIHNMSEDVYKFEWSPSENLKFVPSAGHLRPGANKEIIVSFLSPEPITICKEKLNCEIYKIIWYYPAKCSGSTWDNAQDVVGWSWNGSGSFSTSVTSCHLLTDTLLQHKIVDPAAEPKYDIIDGTKQNLIVLLSAVSDYSTITFSVEEINFQDTFLYQTSEYKIILKNEGIVPSSFFMEIIMTDINYIPQPNWLSGKQQSLQGLIAANSRSVASVIQVGSQLSCNSSRRTRSSLLSETMQNVQCTEGEYEIPFTVIPKEGTIEPAQEMECFVKFTPLFLFEYKSRLLCRILNSHPDAEKPSLTMHGRALVPVCHFQIEESDYLTSGRRIPSLPGPCKIGKDISFVPGAQLSPDTKVIEFKSLGFGHPCVRKFDVLNPTELNFHYYWHRLSKSVSEKEFPFHCNTISGWLASGHKMTASFSFLSEEAGIFESFWHFCVPEMETEIPFLLVGTVSEPCVYFENTNLHFESTFISVKSSVNTHLVNCETVPITFKFDSYSVYSDQNLEHVTVRPMAGRILPNSDVLIRIDYMPTVAGTMNFRLACSVSFLKNPLYLTVSGIVYNIHPIITWKTASKSSELLNMNDLNIIDIEEVVPRRSLKVVFSLTNAGKTTFCYHWILDVGVMRQKHLKVTPSEAKGYVNSHLTTECRLTVTFTKNNPLAEYPFSLQIVNGPEYRLLLRGAAVLPQYRVSFKEYNFGPCFIFNSNIFYYHTTLIFSNEENSSMTLDCNFVNKPYLTVEINDALIAARKETQIVISFKPLDTIKYQEVIELLINGVHRQKIFITGEGAHLRVQVLKAKQKQIDLGLLQVGQTSEKYVSVINKSVTAVPVSFHICKEFKAGVIPEESKLLTEDESDFLQVLPREIIVIKPQQVTDITVTFTAVSRMSFHKMIIMKVFDHIEPLCILKGICAGYEFSFNRDYIYFGVVCEGSHSHQTFSLKNTGDIGSRFKWQQNTFDENFDIKPITGYSSQGSEVVFTVSFHPTEEHEHIRKVILCEIENYKTMELVVSGSCSTLPEPKEVLSFITNVRNSETKTIEISNNTCKSCEIYPEFTGEFFSGAEVLSIPPYSKVPYNITYNPQTMTKGDKHMGTALFRLPEIGVILYELNGMSQPPPASSNLEIEVPCKTDYTGNITARNWLDKTQRFIVFTELIKPDKFDPVFTMSGAEFIDIPANSTRQYQFHFFVYKECTLTFKVTFINEDTEEYEFHELLIRAVKCEPLESIHMTACVRQSGTNHIILQNPTTNNITYTVSCTASDLFFTSPCIVPSNSEVEFSITYTPLFPGEFRQRIEATCTELGSFPYELLLTALPALPEKPMHLNCTLGSSVIANVTIENKANVKAVFNCEIDNNDFKVEKSITLEPSERKDYPVIFEPTNLGTVSATLAITSPIAGNFSFPLIGKCDFPKPQGPFILTPGGTVNINFKNIFRETKTFNVTVSQPAFVVKKTGDTIPPKKELSIKVTLAAAGKKTMTSPIYGKLVVACDDVEMKNVQWTYYLKGVAES